MTKSAPRPARLSLLLLLLAAAAWPAAPAMAQSEAGEQAATAPPAPVRTTPPEATIELDPPPAPPERETNEPARPRTTAPRPIPPRTAPPVPDTVILPADPPADTRAPSVIVEQVPVPVPVPAPVDPYLTTNSVELLPDPAYNEVDVLPEVVTQTEEGGGLGWPLIVIAILLALGALAFLLARGGRRQTIVHRQTHEEPHLPQPLAAVPAVPAARPRIALSLHPLRAGVEAEGARVEFELTVANRGEAAAEEVSVSMWMSADATRDPTRALFPPQGHVATPPVTLAAGETRVLQASVALPRAQLGSVALLPVVAVDARYRLPVRGEARTAAAFLVGLPSGEELGPFAVNGTFGLHDGVVALPLGQTVET
ncbi:MAG TPA: hypothetical protein VEZ70_07915 [Allosphingosinicella sp.]|nr:hypothetical protein [Allosphingosinicella sp.]